MAILETSQVVILGANGQVGSALAALFGDDSIALSRERADLSNIEGLAKTIKSFNPKIIINAAAYTQVDLAESEQELANTVNSTAPKVLADYCLENDAILVHYSTDYVFDGKKFTPYKEDDPTSPINIYGASKLAGENNIINSGCKHLIFRTSWIYDAVNKNFLNTMLRLGKEREELNIVDDQKGAPTHARDLAKATIQALEHSLDLAEFPSGVYHLCNQGEVSWFGFAKAIFELAEQVNIDLAIKELNPITSSQYPTPAARPLNSRMDCSLAKSKLNVELPDWRESLENCFKEIA